MRQYRFVVSPESHVAAGTHTVAVTEALCLAVLGCLFKEDRALVLANEYEACEAIAAHPILQGASLPQVRPHTLPPHPHARPAHTPQ